MGKENAMDQIWPLLASLRELNFPSLVLRLLLAMLCGGVIGMEREYRRRPAGFRTYMFVCIGAALAMPLGQYGAALASGLYADKGLQADVSRIAAQVVNGVGFLGAGTILVTEHQQVKGVTTAAGLWASACMGLAIGAGYYECVLMGFIAILLCMKLFARLESRMLEHIRNRNLFVELDAMEHIGSVTSYLRGAGVTIYSVELHAAAESAGQ